jgi:AcrR family transcriptional regulator
MAKGSKSKLWLKAGYVLFAEDGFAGIQIERLARILGHNKSGFYHYFSTVDIYNDALLDLHLKKVKVFLVRLKEIETVEPGYFQLLIDYKVSLMFQAQLTRIKNGQSARNIVEFVDRSQDAILMPLWYRYLGIDVQETTAMQYFDIVRHMFYSRVDFKQLDYDFLQDLIGDARRVIRELVEQNSHAVVDRI